MPMDITVGLQWGDEGKGRIVDLLAAKADLVARYNGGDNAGHTVTVGKHIFKLHLIPSGIIHPHTFCVMGSGMVINPVVFLTEMQSLQDAGVTFSPERLAISESAHLITPAHRLLDGAQEQALGGGRIGTTGRGIGPAYTDKASRTGLRAGDLLHPLLFKQKLIAHLESVNQKLVQLYSQPGMDIEETGGRLQPIKRCSWPPMSAIPARCCASACTAEKSCWWKAPRVHSWILITAPTLMSPVPPPLPPACLPGWGWGCSSRGA